MRLYKNIEIPIRSIKAVLYDEMFLPDLHKFIAFDNLANDYSGFFCH